MKWTFSNWARQTCKQLSSALSLSWNILMAMSKKSHAKLLKEFLTILEQYLKMVRSDSSSWMNLSIQSWQTKKMRTDRHWSEPLLRWHVTSTSTCTNICLKLPAWLTQYSQIEIEKKMPNSYVSFGLLPASLKLNSFKIPAIQKKDQSSLAT